MIIRKKPQSGKDNCLKALVLAGGEGIKLRPVTSAIPKPMIPINDKPILEHIILHLRHYGIKDVVLAIGYLGQNIEDYFQDGAKFGINITYFKEPKWKTAGTPGVIWHAKNLLSDPFIIYNGDILCNIDIKKLLKFHFEKDSKITIGLLKDLSSEAPSVIIRKDCSVVTFSDKTLKGVLVNSCIGIWKKSALKFFKNKTRFGDVLSDILRSKEKILGFVATNCYWYDVGSWSTMLQIQKDISDGSLHLDS